MNFSGSKVVAGNPVMDNSQMLMKILQCRVVVSNEVEKDFLERFLQLFNTVFNTSFRKEVLDAVSSVFQETTNGKVPVGVLLERVFLYIRDVPKSIRFRDSFGLPSAYAKFEEDLLRSDLFNLCYMSDNSDSDPSYMDHLDEDL